MKLAITSFTTKLENFINETKATDENLLRLLSHLTDSIQAFVLAARVIKTNHTIETIVDKNVLTCESIFECLACNMQTGKTYASVLNHINTAKHIAHVKRFEKQKKQQSTAATTKSSTNLINPVPARVPVTLPPPHFPSNREFDINPNQSMHGINSQLPGANGPFPLLQNHLNHLYPQPVVPSLPTIQRPVLLRPPIVGVNHGLGLPINPIQANAINNFCVNNTTLVNGLIGNYNRLSTSEDLHNYKELFRMPLPTNVVGFQQNVISPSNNFLRKFNETNEESDKIQPVKKQRRRKKYNSKKLAASNQVVEIEVKLLDEKSISFLKGNFENDVVEFIKAAKKLTSDDLYTDITVNLQECCKEMNLNANVKCFGSRIIGIGSAQSDVDLNVTVPGEY